jgi:hypothetical protein
MMSGSSSQSRGTNPTSRTGQRHVGAPGRLIILRSFKPIFCKHSSNVWMGAGKTDFLLEFTFCQLFKESRVETWVNWHHISDLFPLCSNAPRRLRPGWPSPYSGPAHDMFRCPVLHRGYVQYINSSQVVHWHLISIEYTLSISRCIALLSVLYVVFVLWRSTWVNKCHLCHSVVDYAFKPKDWNALQDKNWIK